MQHTNKQLGYELAGVLADYDHDNTFDEVCVNTVRTVREQLGSGLIVLYGKEYTEAQLDAALRCARIVAEAYALASEDNGGGSSIDWETIDMAHLAAGDVFQGADDVAIGQWARDYNAGIAK